MKRPASQTSQSLLKRPSAGDGNTKRPASQTSQSLLEPRMGRKPPPLFVEEENVYEISLIRDGRAEADLSASPEDTIQKVLKSCIQDTCEGSKYKCTEIQVHMVTRAPGDEDDGLKNDAAAQPLQSSSDGS